MGARCARRDERRLSVRVYRLCGVSATKQFFLITKACSRGLSDLRCAYMHLDSVCQDLGVRLQQLGFAGSDDRLAAITQALRQLDFNDLQDLDGADSFEEMLDASSFTVGEIRFLNSIAESITKRGRMQRRGLCADVGSAARASTPRMESSSLVHVIQNAKRSACHAEVAGPAAVCKRLRSELESSESKRIWIQLAKTSAILGNCDRSRNSILSGIRCYMRFASEILEIGGREFPPSVEGLLAWSALFRSPGTFQNYVNYVRVGCNLLGVSADACADPMVRRARGAVAKRRQFVPRKKLFVRLDVLTALMDLPSRGALPGCGDDLQIALMLYLTTYAFMLRLPSEALPIVVGRVGCTSDEEQAVIFVDGDRLVLKLRRRKNRIQGSVLSRACWCRHDEKTCPVHVLGPFFASMDVGSRPFAHFTAAR